MCSLEVPRSTRLTEPWEESCSSWGLSREPSREEETEAGTPGKGCSCVALIPNYHLWPHIQWHRDSQDGFVPTLVIHPYAVAEAQKGLGYRPHLGKQGLSPHKKSSVHSQLAYDKTGYMSSSL